MSNWEILQIKDLVEVDEADLQTGPFGTQLKASEYVSEGIAVINVRNIGYGSLLEAQLEYVNHKTAERLEVHKLLKNDIVFGRKGAIDRHVLITKKTEGLMQGSDCLRLRIKSQKVSNKFISYYFNTQAHKFWMDAQGSFGATMTSLNQDIVKRISFPCPPLPIQKKIAAILSAYDDLIENCDRRITLLEKIAEEIYREWFVRMRFPGHEQTTFHKGIPEGWEVGKIGNGCYVGDGAHASITRVDDGVPYLTTKNFKSEGLDLSNVDYISSQDYKKYFGNEGKSIKTPRYGDILLGIIGSFGKPYLIENSDHFGISSSVAILRPKPDKILSEYLFSYVRSLGFMEAIHAIKSGSAQGFLSLKMIACLPLILPDIRIRQFKSEVQHL